MLSLIGLSVLVLLAFFVRMTVGVSRRRHRRTIRDLQKYPFYYINLNRSDQRRRKMVNTYTKLNLTHKRVIGVDGKKPLPCILSEPTPLKDTQLACLLSHLKAIEQAYFDGAQIAIIQEDDTSFDLLPYWQTSLSAMIDAAPADWQILHVSSFWQMPAEWTGKLSFEEWKGHVIASTYVINRSGMQAYIDAFERVGDTVILPPRGCLAHEPNDTCLYKICKTYIPNTILFVPFKSVSDIHGIINTTMEKENSAIERIRAEFNK